MIKEIFQELERAVLYARTYAKSKKILFSAVLTLFFFTVSAQNDTRAGAYVSGSMGLTNNGISLIPSFSLEQPATQFNMSLGRGRFSFEPEFTFSLQEGRPWYQLFWLRYKVINEGKFRFQVGTHLGLNYVRVLDTNSENVIKTERYLVGELVPSYSINDHLSVGMYYLYAIPFDVETDKNTHFLTFNLNVNNLEIGKYLLFKMIPQVYYLNLYGDEGLYVTSTFTLAKRDFPVELSTLLNKVIKTNVPGNKDFLWNLMLTYSFGKAEIRKNKSS